MPRLAHLLDRSAGWEQRVGLSLLRDRLPPDRFTQTAATIHAGLPTEFRDGGHPPRILHPALPIHAVAAPVVARFCRRESVDLICAWGVDAAAAGRAADRPVVLYMFDPCVAVDRIKLIRTLAQSPGFAVVCSCEIVRRRLVEGGVGVGSCVVVRPGIDFAVINRIRRSDLRERIGLSPEERLVVFAESAPRDRSAFAGYAALTLRNQLDVGWRVIVPGASREAARIARFAPTVPSRPTLLSVAGPVSFERLMAAADFHVVVCRSDISTTSIAWAMAAGAVVIGSATPAVAELIAHRVNGLLYNPKVEHGPVVAVSRLLEDAASHEKVREAARGQAYEVFGVRRCVEQHLKVYENVLRGASPAEGVVDSARAAG